MIVDHDVNKRKKACLHIVRARKSADSSARRKFRLPDINFLAEDYPDMITWKSEEVEDDTEEPIIASHHTTNHQS